MARVKLKSPVRLDNGTVTTCAELLDSGRAVVTVNEKWRNRTTPIYFCDLFDPETGETSGGWEISKYAYESRLAQSEATQKLYVPPKEEKPIEVYSLGTFVDGLDSRIAELKALVHETDNLMEFDYLWESNANSEEWYDFAVIFEPTLSRAQWDIAWQWRTILHEDKEQAILEFVNALVGWY